MAIFNPQYFTNPVASLNTAFGIPTCILSFGVEALKLISSDVLGTVVDAANDGKLAARKAISNVVSDLFNNMGIMQYDGGSGKLSLFSSSSKFGLDLGFLQKLAYYNSYLSEIESFVNQGIQIYEDIAQCIQDMENFLKATGPPEITGTGGIGGGSEDQYTENYRNAALGVARQQVESATVFINQCDELILNIGTVFRDRQQAKEDEEEVEEPIFRLVYGPPVSKQGIFILSEDGLYYDSQKRLYNGKHIPDASDIGVILDSEKWKLDYASNLGGRGEIVSLESLNTYVDTIFDINIIDNTATLNTFYSADHLLNVLEGQKDKLIYDLSAQVGELTSSGYSSDSAVVVNLKKSLNSTINVFNIKINKRKKQIEVAVKGPNLFGSGEVFAPGTIPVNDFSYLSSISIDVALSQQEALTFGAGEVQDVVLPLHPIYVTSYGRSSNVLLQPMIVPPMGKGSIIFNHSVSSTEAPAISLTDEIETVGLFGVYNFLKPTSVAPDSPIFDTWNCASLGAEANAQLIGNTPNLFVSGLGIPLFDGLAKVNGADYKLAQTAGTLRLPPTQDFQNMFYNNKGCSIECWVHIPDYGTSGDHKEVYGSGTPNLYPNKGEWADYNYYKIILANENTGGNIEAPSVSALHDAKGSNSTRGLLIGFTRDPVIYSDTLVIPGTNIDPAINIYTDTSNTVASSCFFVAPTMSINANSVEFVPSDKDCVTDGFRKVVIKDDVSAAAYDDGMGLETSTPKSFIDVSGSFMHIHLSFDVAKDACKIYLDGNLMATSSMALLFGVEVGHMPSVPTFITPENFPNPSFFYSSGTVNQTYPSTLFDAGPRTDQYFTPWIVGGGWTDGFPITVSSILEGVGSETPGEQSLPIEGGFMGTRHGVSSGLNGHVGSLKFYSRPLTIKEVRKNYEAQKGFFKNIKL